MLIAIQIVGTDRFFEPKDVQLLQRASYLQGGRDVFAIGTIGVHHKSDVVANRLANCADEFDVGFESVDISSNLYFHCGKAALLKFLCLCDYQVESAEPKGRRVSFELGMMPTTEKHVQRQVKILSGEIPQGNVDAANCLDEEPFVMAAI